MKPLKRIYFSLMLFSLTLFTQESIDQSQESIKKVETTVETIEPTISSTEEITPKASTPTVNTTDPIKRLIREIKGAKVKDRQELMNQLKVQLREINKESRQKAMMELKTSFTSKANSQCINNNLQDKPSSTHQ